MWHSGTHNPAAQSRARVFHPAERRQTGSEFSPLVDAFHPSFPASIEDYISQPREVNAQDPTHGRANSTSLCPEDCHRFGRNARHRVDSVSRDGYSTDVGGASNAHSYHADRPQDILLLSTSDSISKLPPEVSDLILSYLSPAALDAARHTCKYWRTRILSNTWILFSVLGKADGGSPSNRSPSDRLSHRNLLKKLDRDSDLPSTFQHPDAWRTRVRTRDLGFSTPSPSSSLTRPVLVAAARTGIQNGFLAFQLQEISPDTRNHTRSTLVVYCFDSAEIPCYAGAVHDVEGQGALRITGLTEIKPHAEWVLKIDIGDTAGLYSLTARKAFASSEPRFSLKCLESLEKFPSLLKGEAAVPGFDRSPEPIPIGDPSWTVLAAFPPNEGSHHVCSSEGLRKHTGSRFLAEHIEIGNINVIVEFGPSRKPSQHASYSQPQSPSSDSESSKDCFTSIALLSRPRPNSVYKNVAVAPTILKDGSSRAAIIWQTEDLETPINELYIYDIPEAVCYEPCRAYSQSGSDSGCTTEIICQDAPPRPCRLVQGKRVTSLEQHMGGTHPSSLQYRLASPQELALGGLQLPHTTENQEAYPQNVQYQKCFVWGPTSSERECTQMSMKVFDFSFADPQRLHSVVTYNVGSGRRRDKRFHNIILDSLHCACALHDDAFRIVLPDVTIDDLSEPASERESATKATSSSLQKNATLKENLSSLNGVAWSFWPRKPASARDSVQNIGSISRNDSPGRRAALERRQEWLRGRILGMRRVGLTDFEIAELWGSSAWTQYGQVRKPDGWQGLGKGEVVDG